ncbi:Hypothetical predicted protein [Olea europaea subsp. europaea]|uniref:Uncharacterized protein n=1 Tax=Olea europaea subsp. europaea TaxID=158383 RepID=A0A8S0PXG3_OLEEU|nr:Hypothetical predicted protein [Olea europaea subsp. europaea]
MVLQENNVRKEEIKMRAVALRIPGKEFQRSRGSSENINCRAPFVTQGINRLFRCLCNPAFDVDDEEIVYKRR